MREPMERLIIYDFDGVIAESEVLANTVLAEIVTDLGKPTTVQDCYRLFMGKRFAEVIVAVEAHVGRALPADFPSEFQARTLARFREALCFVGGAREFIDSFMHIPHCIASSSSPDRLSVCLDVLDLRSAFDGRVYSASSVSRGKPHPDIFLHAAQQMGFAPAHCIVIEDSASGVAAGVAAGMTVIGLLAAGHIQHGHSDRLAAAGAHHVAATFAQAEAIMHGLLEAG